MLLQRGALVAPNLLPVIYVTVTHVVVTDQMRANLFLVTLNITRVSSIMDSASSSSSFIGLNGHTPTNGSTTSISHQSELSHSDDANVSLVSPVPVSNGYSQ